jgi:ribokinase
VATVRAIEALAAAGVELDMLVASANDAGERYVAGAIEPPPRLIARTDGVAGGSLEDSAGTTTHWETQPLPGPPVDSYGAGDCFAAGLSYGLGEGRSPAAALALAARCGAACVTGRGPYSAQLSRPD